MMNKNQHSNGKCHVRIWRFTIFGCTAEIGRDRANADLAPSLAANAL
jgi:hypothetical protein